MTNKPLIPISEYNKLAILDLYRVKPERIEWTSKYWAYFDPTKVEEILEQYENETLQVNAADFVAAVRRVKDRIFEAQRTNRKLGVVNSDDQSFRHTEHQQ